MKQPLYHLEQKIYALYYPAYIDPLDNWTNFQNNFLNYSTKFLDIFFRLDICMLNDIFTLFIVITFVILCCTALIVSYESNFMFMNNLETDKKLILEHSHAIKKNSNESKIADFRLKIYRDNWKRHVKNADAFNTKEVIDGKFAGDKEFTLYSIEVDDKNSNLSKKEKLFLLQWIELAYFTNVFKLSSPYTSPKLKNNSGRKIKIEQDNHGYYAKILCPTSMILTPGVSLQSKQKDLYSLSDLNFDVDKGLIFMKIYYVDPN